MNNQIALPIKESKNQTDPQLHTQAHARKHAHRENITPNNKKK